MSIETPPATSTATEATEPDNPGLRTILSQWTLIGLWGLGVCWLVSSGRWRLSPVFLTAFGVILGYAFTTVRNASDAGTKRRLCVSVGCGLAMTGFWLVHSNALLRHMWWILIPSGCMFGVSLIKAFAWTSRAMRAGILAIVFLFGVLIPGSTIVISSPTACVVAATVLGLSTILCARLWLNGMAPAAVALTVFLPLFFSHFSHGNACIIPPPFLFMWAVSLAEVAGRDFHLASLWLGTAISIGILIHVSSQNIRRRARIVCLVSPALLAAYVAIDCGCHLLQSPDPTVMAALQSHGFHARIERVMPRSMRLLYSQESWRYHTRGFEQITSISPERGAEIDDADVVAALPFIPSSVRRFSLGEQQQITGRALAQLGQLSGLRELDLQGVPVTRSGIEAISALTSLTSLSIAGPGVSDESLRLLRPLTGLEKLDVGHSAVTGTGLAEFVDMPLRELDLFGCKLTEDGLDAISKLKSLEVLNLQFTPVTDSSILRLKDCTRLREMWLLSTQATEAGAEALSKLLPDTKIHSGRRTWLQNPRTRSR